MQRIIEERFEKFGRQREYLVLQDHPNGWTDERFEAFAKVVKYLEEQGCTFMTVSELVALRAAKNH